MTAKELLATLRRKGFVLAIEDGKLCCVAPPELRNQKTFEYVRRHKEELLALLAREGSKPPEDVPCQANPRLTAGQELLDALWAAGYSIELAESASGGWFLLPVGNPPPQAGGMTAAELFALYDKLHDQARDCLLEALAGVNMTPGDWNTLVRSNRMERAPHKPQEAAPPSYWTAEDARLAEWALSLTPDDLPPAPWNLRPGEVVADNAGFLAALQRECRAAPRGPRAKMGTLQAELRRLREATSTPYEHDEKIT
jgi:hypothetical protein